MQNTTSSGVGPVASVAGVTPEFIRLPKPSTLCPFSGLTRSTMNALVLPGANNEFTPPVKSKVLRRSGNLRGVRLIVYASLMGYLHSLPGQPTGTGPR